MKSEVVFGLEGAPWPALLVDVRGTVKRANPAARRVFGAALNGEPPALGAIWSPENGGAAEDFFARWVPASAGTVNLKWRGAGGVPVAYSTAICAFLQEGQEWFLLQLLPAGPVEEPSRSGTDPGVLLKQKLDCALQLARTVALDFNNALTSILGHTSLLLSKAEAGHPWRHSLMEVEKSAARAAEIANELQLFSRQEKETRRTPPGNLNVIVQRCVEFFQNSNPDRIRWYAQLERELFAARFDEAKLQQAITKILENAVEAVGDPGQITLQSRNVDLAEPTQDRNVRLAAGTYVCVEVNDNGQGIEPDVLPRVFEPFFTTKSAPHRGLGLALVYGIVTNHGGGVAVSSQPRTGTSVRLYLPAERQLVHEIADSSADLHGTATVLLVDDEDLLLTMGEAILTEYGYKVLTANSGQKALGILTNEATQVELLVTDLVMPAMSGRELVEHVRQLAPDLPILCSSGYILPVDRQTGTAYLQKPFTSRELLQKVKQTLAARK